MVCQKALKINLKRQIAYFIWRPLSASNEENIRLLSNDSKLPTRRIRNTASYTDAHQLRYVSSSNPEVITTEALKDWKPPAVADAEDSMSFSTAFSKHEEWKQKLVNTMLVYHYFVTEDEEKHIIREVEPYLNRLRYEDSHWDDAIHEYRETEKGRWNKRNTEVLSRVRALAFPPEAEQLKHVHVLDLAKKGVIKPHIDSVRFCGNIIAGLSLLSNSVMRLRHDVQRDFYCDVYLPRLSIYVMKDFARYEFTHEILGEAESQFKGKKIARDRRISIMCRNEPVNKPTNAN